jgi:YVTN family beta-propeller protein
LARSGGECQSSFVPDPSSDSITFLFTDIEGSTRLLHALGEEYAAVLTEHQRLLRTAFAQHDGREIDTQGDAFFVAFPTPREAILSAIEGLRALREHRWPDGVQVKVRIGMDTGPAALMQDRYTGRAVHRAARVSAAGHGGQILVSDASERLLEKSDGFLLRDLGARRLKDIEGRVRIFQVHAPELESDFPALKTLDVVRRRRLQLSAGLASAAFGVTVAFVLVLGRSTPVRVAPNSLGVIQPRNNRVTGQFPVGKAPGVVASGFGSVWVANVGDKTVSRVDPFTKSVVKTIDVPGTPDSVAVGPGAIWVVHGFLHRLTRVDPDVNKVAITINVTRGNFVPGAGGAVAVGDAAVWAAYSDATVAKVDPAANRVVATGFAGRNPAGAAFGAGSLWVANHAQNTVSLLDPRSFRRGPKAVIDVGRGPSGVAVGGGYVWVANTDDDSVSRIDPLTRVVRHVHVGGAPIAVAYGADSVWVADRRDGTVKRLDPRSGRVKATIHVGNSPSGIAVDEGLVWVSVDAR